MAVKHIKEYYNKVCDQYIDMQNELKDFQSEVEKGLVEPERLDTLKALIEPIKNNYMTISWIMYLLNMPNRDSKKRAYEKRSEKFIKNLDPNFNEEGIIKENESYIEKLRGV